MSNWFSSLRRPQKHKKSTIEAKKFQKSCIDLRSNSIFYAEIPPPVSSAAATTTTTTSISNATNNYIESYIPLDEREKRRQPPQKPQQNESLSNLSSRSDDRSQSINNNNTNCDRKGLLSGRNVRQLCSKCCCKFQKSSSGIFIIKQQPIDSKSEFKIETDCITDVKLTKIPCAKGGNKLIYSKRYETKRTTTTLMQRTTTLVTNRSGLIFDDQGDVLSQHFRKSRASSLGSILDDKSSQSSSDIGHANPNFIIDNNNRNIGDNWDGCADAANPKTLYASSTHSSPLLECNDFLFIDESQSSSSGGESASECNRLNLLNSNFDSHNNNYNNNNSNQCDINSQELCSVCKNPLNPNSNEPNLPNNRDVKNVKRKQIKDELCEVVSEMETLDSQEGCKHSNKDKQMSIGRKKFNMDPKKGIEYLVDNHLLRMDPQDVAHFLYKGEGLNKTAIGDYLGEKNDFNEQVLKAFVELHDFTNLILVQALRQFLWSFRLPGEAQKIDRMMECFAQRYCQLNPDIFTNTDTCYVLSFAIIMLNTSLHNPSVKDKPSVEQFITMNRGINNGGDLPRSLLESLYESIRTEPFKIPQDDGNDLMHTFFNPDKEGWLWKQGGRYKSWKRRWFILNDNCLYYFEYTTDKEPRGIIPLENISVREIQDRSKPHCFELYASGGADIIKACKTDSEGKVVEGKHTVYRMSAATEEDKQEWIKRLTQSISHNPFYDILVQRKKKALAKS